MIYVLECMNLFKLRIYHCFMLDRNHVEISDFEKRLFEDADYEIGNLNDSDMEKGVGYLLYDSSSRKAKNVILYNLTGDIEDTIVGYLSKDKKGFNEFPNFITDFEKERLENIFSSWKKYGRIVYSVRFWDAQEFL